MRASASPDYWFTADSHFGHGLLAELRGFTDDRFGLDVERMDEALITAWNSRVKPGDIVYHLGDFMLPQNTARADEILGQLHGTKHLIRGNHERNATERAKRWSWVGDYRHKRIRSGFHVILFHYAMRTWEGSGRGWFHLYGHSHGNLAPDYGRSMDVGVDTRADYAPWHYEEIYARLTVIEPLIVDHHTPDAFEVSAGSV